MNNHDSILIPPGMRSGDGRLRCTRVCRLREDGTLISPHQGTEWTSYRMTANRFTDGGELRNEAGLHAVWYLPRATPSSVDVAVLHCLASGQVRVGDLGLRSEVMEVQEIVLHPDVLDGVLESVRRRYPECRVRKARKQKLMLVLTDVGSYGMMTVNGLFHGRWVCSDGAVRHYLYGMSHGRWIYPDGRVERYRYGKKHGRWTYPDGRIERYRNGWSHGRWTWPDGRVGHYRNGLPHGLWTYTDGRVCHYRDNKRHGRWSWPNGCVGHYRNDWRHGRWTWPDGRVGHYCDGKKHGRWVWPSGRVERYRYGKKHGRWTYPDGRVERYRGNKRHGRWTWTDGRVGHYRDGNKHGRWTYPDGRIEIYDMGKLVKSIEPAVSSNEVTAHDHPFGFHPHPSRDEVRRWLPSL